ncbi:hypothetical protein SAMN05192569_10238 [Parageobacillus thermantarcticus]|uniref:Uncharacterized protein n=1 Tax=Parageobacillus thermantarcticus TaxID=186116 RepID=A0A1I0TE78_9BACL|nr:hypothetical protein SAMN05192569_10238 [Parageobacillus thermantarcticus]
MKRIHIRVAVQEKYIAFFYDEDSGQTPLSAIFFVFFYKYNYLKN